MALTSTPTSQPDMFFLEGAACDASMEVEDDDSDDEDGRSMAKKVMGVAQTWKQDFSDASIVVFDEHPTCTILSGAVVVKNRNAIVPHKIVADSLVWRRMRAPDGAATGSAFLLYNQSELQMTIEVTLRSPACEDLNDLQRVALVQPRYSAIAAAAGTCSPSDFLEFDLPQTRLQDMKNVKSLLLEDEEQGYLPVREVMTGTALDRLIVQVNEEECKTCGQTEQQLQTPVADAAHPRQVWSVTKRFLRDLSTSVRECTQLHAQRELQPLGLLEHAELSDVSFRAYID